jgi:hypothetical protein
MFISRSKLLSAVVGIAVLGTICQFIGGVTATAAPLASGPGTKSVIVVLHDQLASLPPDKSHVGSRRLQATSDQNSVLGRLSGAKPMKLNHFAVANAFSVTVTPAQAAALSADPSVAAVIPDEKVSVTVSAPPIARAPLRTQPAPNLTPPVPGACPTDPTKPLLEPEALTDTNTASDNPADKTAQQLTDGSGVKVAYIADGINPDSPDFIRPNGQHVITDYKAFSADGQAPADGGAEAFGDASSIAAQGTVPHDLSTFVNPAYSLPVGCNIRIEGMAPGASIVALKVDFYTSSIVQAIDYAVSTAHVDVLNESFGGNPTPDSSSRSAISLFNDMAVAAGVTVTVSSGDAGITGTIGNPSTDPNVISVGATTNSRGYAQTGYAAFRFSNGTWVNDEVSSLSSAGFTQGGRTIDLSAPGEAGWAACEASSPECANYNGGTSDFQLFGGTSQSAPLTAGAAALVISAYRATHSGASPSPSLVKTLLVSTATDLGLPAEEQGAGLLNSRAAVEAAMTYPDATALAPSDVASNIALSTNQLNISGAPGSTHTSTVTVRNVGNKPLTVSTGTRTFATLSTASKTVALNATTDPTFPYATSGAPWVYKKVTFTVPAGMDRLSAQMIWQGAARTVAGFSVTPVVRLTVLDPTGTYVADSRPQGGSVSANYANLDVRQPKAGTWTAIVYTVFGASGYTGDVTLETDTQRAEPVGRITPAVFALSPGQARPVQVSLTTPTSGGDIADAVTFATSAGHTTAVPAVLRTVVRTSTGAGRFAGTITGGNGRAGSASESFTYAFDVPRGKQDLDVAVQLANDPGDLLEGVLVDPHDQVQSVGSNAHVDRSGNVVGQGLGMQLTTANPVPGRWRMVVLVQNPVTGNEISQAFAGLITFDQNHVTTTGLPNSPQKVLPVGKAVKVNVKVTNTGIAPMNVQLDPRTRNLQTLQLAPQGGSSTVALPGHTAPYYIVPPGTESLTAVAASSLPALVELTPFTGGIDVVGDLAAAQTGSTVSVATVSEKNDTLSNGIWFTDVDELGFFGTTGAPPGSSTLTTSARTPGFDSSVTSSTGDPFLSAIDPTADTGTAVTIQPGETKTIKITIVPAGKQGRTVSGLLNVVTPPAVVGNFVTTGDVVVQVPYSYTVGGAQK